MTPMDQALGEMRFLNEDTDPRYRERDLRKYAKEKDLVLVIPEDNQLLIDIDNFEDRRIFDTYFEIFLEKMAGTFLPHTLVTFGWRNREVKRF